PSFLELQEPRPSCVLQWPRQDARPPAVGAAGPRRLQTLLPLRRNNLGHRAREPDYGARSQRPGAPLPVTFAASPAPPDKVAPLPGSDVSPEARGQCSPASPLLPD